MTVKQKDALNRLVGDLTKPNFAPRYCLIGAGTAIAAVEFLTRVDEDGVVGTVPDAISVQCSNSLGTVPNHECAR